MPRLFQDGEFVDAPWFAMHSIRFHHSNMCRFSFARQDSKQRRSWKRFGLEFGPSQSSPRPSAINSKKSSVIFWPQESWNSRQSLAARWKVANLWIIRAYLMTGQWSQQFEVPPEILTWLVTSVEVLKWVFDYDALLVKETKGGFKSQNYTNFDPSNRSFFELARILYCATVKVWGNLHGD